MSDDAIKAVRHLPNFSLSTWDLLYKFICDWQPHRCLDLGFGYGASTVCIAGALRACGRNDNCLTAIDVENSRRHVPNVETLLSLANMRDYVSVRYETKSFNWALLDILERKPGRPLFDFINIDSPRTWYSMGFAAMLTTQLLNPGGWLVLNGVNFTFASSFRRKERWVRNMPPAEQTTPQVNKIFDILVKRNSAFSTYRSYGNLYFARRRAAEEGDHNRDPSDHLDLLVCDVLARAYADPDFRFDLIWNSGAALRQISSEADRVLSRVRFSEADRIAIGRELTATKGHCYLLPPPWCSRETRTTLVQLLKGIRQSEHGRGRAPD